MQSPQRLTRFFIAKNQAIKETARYYFNALLRANPGRDKCLALSL